MNEGLRGKLEAEIEPRAAWSEKETSPGRARAAYSGATLLLRKEGVPGREKLRPLWVSQSQIRAMRDEVLPRSRTERLPQGRRPGALAAPSPGVSTRDTPPPVLDSAAAAEQSHARLCRGTRVLQPVGVVPLKGFSAAGPGTRFQLRRLSGTDTDPRGRHDGLRAAPQRGQAPPPVPPPATPESPERGPIGPRRRSPTHCHTFGFQPHCLRQPGSARPFKGSFPELKVSDEETPAPSALLLVFDKQRVSRHHHAIGQ